MSIFGKATRLKLRFIIPNRGGSFTVEDLWDLPLGALDSLAVELNRQLQDTNPSFIENDEETDLVIQQQELLKKDRKQTRFDIVRHIIRVKLEDNKRIRNASVIAAKKQKLLGILARKEDQELEATSIEDLRKLINEL